MDQHYRLNLENYAAPGYISFPKRYYGTLSQFQSFFDALAADKKNNEHFQARIEAFRAYLNGQTDVQHHVHYNQEPLFVPVDVLKTATIQHDRLTWEHLNIWQCPYEMACDRAETTHLWLKDDDRYFRCLQVRFENLKYEGRSFRGSFWGFPQMMVEDGTSTSIRLAVIEKRFDSLQEWQEDMAAFNGTDIDFTEVCNELFGDG